MPSLLCVSWSFTDCTLYKPLRINENILLNAKNFQNLAMAVTNGIAIKITQLVTVLSISSHF